MAVNESCVWYPFAGTLWLPTYLLLLAVSINLTFVIVFLCTQLGVEQRRMHWYQQRGDALETEALERFKRAMVRAKEPSTGPEAPLDR